MAEQPRWTLRGRGTANVAWVSSGSPLESHEPVEVMLVSEHKRAMERVRDETLEHCSVPWPSVAQRQAEARLAELTEAAREAEHHASQLIEIGAQLPGYRAAKDALVRLRAALDEQGR